MIAQYCENFNSAYSILTAQYLDEKPPKSLHRFDKSFIPSLWLREAESRLRHLYTTRSPSSRLCEAGSVWLAYSTILAPSSTLDRIRTCDLLVRNQTLYPLSHEGKTGYSTLDTCPAAQLPSGNKLPVSITGGEAGIRTLGGAINPTTA